MLAGEYYIVNRQRVCSKCADLVREGYAITRAGAWIDALVFGLAGAFIGTILYAAFTVTTGFTIGFFALAVGWIVGAAIMAGDDNVGGKHLQILATLLTYAAITLKELPVTLYQAYLHSGSTTEWFNSLPKAIATGLASPFLLFNTNAFRGVLNLVILAVGLRIAWRITAARRQVVAGPYCTE